MVSLEIYKVFFYFTVIWLIAGIAVVCFSILRHFWKKHSRKGDQRQS